MKYYTRMHTEDKITEITKEDAKWYLEGYYKASFVKDIIDNHKSFRLSTSYRIIWTVTNNGTTPQPGFYGVC